MEIIDEVLFVYDDKVLFPLDGVFGGFPFDTFEADGIVLYFRRTQETVGETILEGVRGVVALRHHHIGIVASDDAVSTFEQHVTAANKTQCRSPAGIERIELCKGAMVNGGFSAVKGQTVTQGVSQLAVFQDEVAAKGDDAVTFGIMDHAARHCETGHIVVDGSRVEADSR